MKLSRHFLPASIIAIACILALCEFATAASAPAVPVPGGDGGWFREFSGTSDDLHGVSALNSSHVWAVGSNGRVVFYNGSQWIIQPTDTTWYLQDVSAASTNHVWAVGDNGGIYFFNGTAWHAQANPATATLNGVCALDNNHVWAVGDHGKIYYFNGAAWSEKASPTTKPLYGVTALDTQHAWAVGEAGTILFFNGTTWVTQPCANTHDFYSVSAADTHHVWAVGDWGQVYLYNGTAWTKQTGGWLTPDGTGNAIFGVTALDANNVWASSGGVVTSGEHWSIMKWNGSAWTAMGTARVPDEGTNLFDIDACSADNVWTVGNVGQIYSRNPGSVNRYSFAEGCTRPGFEEWLCLQNPGEDSVSVNATFMLQSGTPILKTYTVPPTSRITINVNGQVGPDQDVSVTLEGRGEFYAERSMYFDYRQGEPGYGWDGGHVAKGTAVLGNDWYFAEGTTRTGFEEWLCVQNPSSARADVQVTYSLPGEDPVQKVYSMDPTSRISISVNADVGPEKDVAAMVHSATPIVAERPMYFNYKSGWTGGHDVMGVGAPRTEWYFAEGTTRTGFEEWLTVMNPIAAENQVELNLVFVKGDGTIKEIPFTMGDLPRVTLNVNDLLGEGVDSAVVVRASVPVIAERAMYFSYRQAGSGSVWSGGHDVVGANETRFRWFFAEGCTNDNFDEYLCIANPEALSPAHVTIRFMLETGEVITHPVTVNANTRVTLKVADIVGRGHDVAAEITTYDSNVIVERPMYFDYKGWTGGHVVIGF